MCLPSAFSVSALCIRYVDFFTKHDTMYIKMDIKEGMMKIINATDARRQFFNLIKRSVKGHEEFRITHKDGDAILLSDEDKVVTLIASHIKIA